MVYLGGVQVPRQKGGPLLVLGNLGYTGEHEIEVSMGGHNVLLGCLDERLDRAGRFGTAGAS